jgi:amino acid adenylation domain-containing protein
MTSIDQSTTNMTPEERRELLAHLLREKSRASRTAVPLSHGQAALWFTHQMAPDSPAYNVAFAAFVRSPVDVAAMGRALQALIDRHDMLRTTFHLIDGRPQQVIAGTAALDFVQVDGAGWSNQDLHGRIEDVYRQHFDLEHGPLLRVRLFTRGPADHVLLAATHHVVFDAWSMGILVNELQALYRAECGGTPANLPPVQFRYTDFVAWQQKLLAGPAGLAQRDYWHAKLAGDLPLLDLPTDRPRSMIQNHRGATYNLHPSRILVRQLRALAKTEHTTLFSVLLAAFYVLLYRHSGQEDVIVGTPMVGRNRAEFERTIGYFVSPAALRADVSGNPSFRKLLGQVRRIVLDALEHQDYPFARLVEELQPRRDPSRSPIIEVLFNVLQAQRLGNIADRTAIHDGLVGHESGRLDFELYPLSQEDGQFDLTLLIVEDSDDLFGELKYNPDLFDESTIVRLADHYWQLLESIVADPNLPIDDLPLLTEPERHQLLVEWNRTQAEPPRDLRIHATIDAAAEQAPDAAAVIYKDRVLTYAELNARANRLAHHLRRIGVKPNTPVALCVERSAEMIVGILGILKAGGAYIPLDPDYPRERLAFILADTRAPVMLAQAHLSTNLPPFDGRVLRLDADQEEWAGESSDNPAMTASPDDLAYIIYTSGSTGQPKGVMVTHSNLAHSTAARISFYPERVERYLLLSSFAFDSSVAGIFWTLCEGSALVLPEQKQEQDVNAVASLIAKHGVTHTLCLPSLHGLLLDHAKPGQLDSLRVVIVAGEACPPDLPCKNGERLPNASLYNEYGPTEGTVWSTACRLSTRERYSVAPIGRSIPFARNYILDARQQPVPIGVAGELYIGGAGVVPGYLNRPELTAERFIEVEDWKLETSSPHGIAHTKTSDLQSVRIYRTGDLARYRPDGNIEFLGRTDHQVKIRGYRIELGEIENALTRFNRVREAAVATHPDVRGHLRLVAYLVTDEAEGPRPGAGELRTFLRTGLPDYMIPSAFVFLDKLPLTANGKVDRRALLPPDAVQARGDERVSPPTTPTEQAIAAVWRDALNLDRVGVYDNFFDLGGHSLMAIDVLARLERQLGVKLGPADIRLQTLGQLSATYDEHLAEPNAPPPAAAAGKDQGRTERLMGAVRRIVARENPTRG